jgi:vacuole morphology and inheritance protein 14
MKKKTLQIDRLLKDTVTENSSNEKFDIIVFMQLLRERIYVKNSYVRQFLVSWLKVLDSEPNINIIAHISDLLDGLFQILDDSNAEIKKMCEVLLENLLKEIIEMSKTEEIKYHTMINVIIVHSANTSDDSIQYTSMIWLKELVNIIGNNSLYFMPGILNVILPCLSYPDDGLKRTIKELARSINFTLWNLIENNNNAANNATENKIAIEKLIETLCRFMTTSTSAESLNTTIESLKWILHLVNKQSDLMLHNINDFFPILISFLSDPSKEAVELDLKILATISVSPYFIKTKNQDEYLQINFPKYNNYFTKFLTLLLDIFRHDPIIRYDEGTLIIKELCVLLNPQDIFRMLAEILSNEKNTDFAISMVDILNTILLTSSELFDLRNSLKDFNTNESYSLFTCLYKTWCHNPIATVALCLLSQNYEHASNLVNLFGDIEISLDLLITIDKLVQLIESSIFAYLRLHLLQVERNQYLVRALYGLLMILPQSESFMTLKQRLDCVPNYYNKIADNLNNTDIKKDQTTDCNIDFKELLQYFIKVQETHKFFRNSKRIVV